MADEPTAAPSSAPSPAPAAPAAPSSPAPAAAAAPSSSRLDGLTSDFLPGEKPAPSPEPSPTAEPAPSPEPAPAQAQRIKIRGKEYTFEEILQNDFLQQALLQTYEQFPALQKKYTDMLERERAEPQRQMPQIDPRVEQAQLVAHYAPQIAQVVREGRIEEDFAQLYPNAVAQMLWHRDQLYQLGTAFTEFRTANAGQTRRAEATGHQTQLTATLDQIAGQGAIFAPLKDAKERAGFLDFVIEMGDPPVSKLTPDFLARMWVAFKHDTIVTAAQTAAERDRIQRENDRRRAAGDGKGSRPTPAPAAAPSLLDSLTEPFLPRR